MKKGYWVIVALMTFSIIFSIIAICLMPDQVPVHYDGAGVVDRMGNRFENLILPVVMILIGLPWDLTMPCGNQPGLAVLLQKKPPVPPAGF